VSEEIAHGVGELGDKNVRPLFYGGQCYYVRKATRGDRVGPNFWRRQLGGVEIPETAVDYCLTVEILAKGPRVGKRCTKQHAKTHNRPRQIDDNLAVGDLVLCPNRAGAEGTSIQKSRYVDYEFFIEEAVPLGVWREEDDNAR